MDLGSLVVDALRLVLVLAAPALGASVLTGLAMAIVQSVTQANDASLGFVPRFLAVGAALFLSRNMMVDELVRFSSRVLQGIGQLGQ